MTHHRWLATALCASLAAGCASTSRGAGNAQPAVVVMISVDQLRADLVTRYAPFYSDGMKRLIDQGAHFDAVHDHGWSETAPGHATLSTGVVPARSGIVANEWQQRRGDGWVDMYTVGDEDSPIIGFADLDGMSPRNLLHSGLADWTVEANPAAKVVSIAGKDRSAVLMAAHTRGSVYWYDTGLKRFITSRYYTDGYPDWVARFNDVTLPTLLDSVWEARAPAGAKALARPDTAAYEGEDNAFPHRYALVRQGNEDRFGDWVSRTPYPDRAVVELAKVAVRENGIGQDGVTDFLSLGFSQADRIGHRFGPLSREQLENLLHLDVVLGDLFRFLDEEIGEGRWVAALSADHGARTMPEWEALHGMPEARRLTSADRRQMTDLATAARAAAPAGQEAAAAARAVSTLPFIAGVYTLEELSSGSPRDSMARLIRNSFHPDRMKSELVRSGTLTVGQPYMYMSTSTTGSGHGTVWYYDRSVPLIFLGAGVAPGRRPELVRTVDLAPTLAALGGVRAPTDLDGTALKVNP